MSYICARKDKSRVLLHTWQRLRSDGFCPSFCSSTRTYTLLVGHKRCTARDTIGAGDFDRVGDIIRKKKNGRFIGFYIRWVDVDGTRRQRASHQPTLALARKMLVEIEAKVARGQAGLDVPKPPAQALTVAELCTRWLDECGGPKIKDLTRYRSTAQTALRRILPLLGNLPAASLTQSDLERVRNQLCTRYRPNTVRAALRPLGTCLSWAVRVGLLTHSPQKGLELPPRESSLEYLTLDEARRLLSLSEQRARTTDRVQDWSRAVAIAIALRQGLRRGEIFGLRWQDIDLASGRMSVMRSYRLAPKSGQVRHLPLHSALIPLLQDWQTRCPKTPERLLCPVQTQTGFGMSGRRVSHGLPKLLHDAKCQPLARGFHALRHTFASQFIMQGGNILTLQKLLGHADLRMTLIYSHLAPDFLSQELERLRY